MFALLNTVQKKERQTRNIYTLLRIEYALRLMKKADISNVDIRLTKQYIQRHMPGSALDAPSMYERYMALQKDSLMDWNTHHWWKCIKQTAHDLCMLYDQNAHNDYSLVLLDQAAVHSVQQTLDHLNRVLSKEVYPSIAVKLLFDKLNRHGELIGELEALSVLAENSRRMFCRMDRHNTSYRSHVAKDIAGLTTAGPVLFTTIRGICETLCKCDELTLCESSVSVVNRTIHQIASILSIFTNLLFHEQMYYTMRLSTSDDPCDALFQSNVVSGYAEYNYRDILAVIRPYTHANSLTPELALPTVQSPVYCQCVSEQAHEFGDTDAERYVIIGLILREWHKRNDDMEPVVIAG